MNLLPILKNLITMNPSVSLQIKIESANEEEPLLGKERPLGDTTSSHNKSAGSLFLDKAECLLGKKKRRTSLGGCQFATITTLNHPKTISRSKLIFRRIL